MANKGTVERGAIMVRAQLSETEWKELRILAIERNTSTSQLVGELIRAELEKVTR